MTTSSTFLTRPVSGSAAQGGAEALWFPVHSSVSDSFSRPIQPDGSARPASDTAIGDDGIGLPSPRQPRKGGRGPKGRGPGSGLRYGWLWISLAGVAVVAAGATLLRKEIAQQVAQNWLSGQGVHARVKLDHLSLGDAAGTVIVGDPQKPEFSIGHFEADYTLNLFAGGGSPLARVSRLRLVDPLVAFSYRKGKLNFGSLDKLVQSALTAPPSGSPPPDDIVVEGAQLVIDSDYGVVRGKGKLSLHAGQLTQMVMDVPATRFNGPLGAGDLESAHITAQSVGGQSGDQLHIQAHLNGDSWVLRDSADAVEEVAAAHERLRLSGAKIDIDGLLPYRKGRSGADAFSGQATTTIAVAADRLVTQGASLDAVRAAIRLDGQLKTATAQTAITGVAQVTGSAGALQSGDMSGRALQIAGDNLQIEGHADGQGTRLLLNGAVTGDLAGFSQPGLAARDAHLRLSSLSLSSDAKGVNAGFRGDLTAGGFATGDLALDQSRLNLEGTASNAASEGTWAVAVKGDLASDQAHYSGLHAAAQGRKPGPNKDAPTDGLVALDRAFDRFSLRAKGIGLTISGDASGAAPRLTVTARTPVVASLNGGGRLVISPKNDTLYSNQTPSALGIDLSGGGLPTVALGVSAFRAAPNGGFGGAYTLTADISADPVVGAHLTGHGAFRSTPDGVFTVSSDGPVAFTAKSAELGEHVENITGSVTQTGPNLVMVSPAGWRIGGNFRALSFTAPTEQVRFDGGEGTFSTYSIPHSDALGFEASLTTSRLGDALPANEARFKLLLLAGAMKQDSKALNGHFFAAVPLAGKAPVRIAAIDLNNVAATSRGSLSVRTLDLTFAPGSLQPGDLSPMADVLFGKNASGKASFDGAFHWAGAQATSGGTLKIDGLDYVGATGVTHNLHGLIAFTSLAPLASPPGQRVQISNMVLGLPLSNLDVSLHFGGERLSVERASVDTPGGPVTLDPLDIAFDGKAPITSVVNFNGLDFGKVVAATDLAKSMRFEGLVSGRLPFSIENGHVRLSQGEMSSDAPGRISVYRQAVTGVQATGSMTSDAPAGADSKVNAEVKAKDATDPAFNPFQDLAFQAMEHISFDKIDARLNSQGPILDVNFHIKGRFDPPQKQKATVSLFDYISGKWMQKPIKLPSGTPVELFLELPFNSDDLTSNIATLNALVGGK